MDLTLNLDLSGIREVIDDLQRLEAEAKKKVGDLAAQTHLHIKEDIQRDLHSRRDMYDEALNAAHEVSEGVWVITLDKKAVWIEEGMEPHSMVEDLLANNARTAKDGSRYRAIPFDVQGKGPARATAGGLMLAQTLKAEMKKRNISYKSVERHPDGSVKTGLLHKFNITDAPTRPGSSAGKPGFGKGPVGSVMQGPNAQGGSGGGTPLLSGVRVFQTAVWKKDAAGNNIPDLDKAGRQKGIRGVMTFRMVSTKHIGLKWNHPGLEGKNFFERAETWAKTQWDTQIVPELLRSIGATNN